MALMDPAGPQGRLAWREGCQLVLTWAIYPRQNFPYSEIPMAKIPTPLVCGGEVGFGEGKNPLPSINHWLLSFLVFLNQPQGLLVGVSSFCHPNQQNYFGASSHRLPVLGCRAKISQRVAYLWGCLYLERGFTLRNPGLLLIKVAHARL